MGRRPSIIAAAVGVGAATALVLVARGASASQMQAVAADLDGRVRETAAAAQARAETLAQLPRLAWAVSTDEQTMLDLTADELAFRPAPGELIEIGQVARRTGAVTSLLRLGGVAGGRLPLDDAGQHLVGHDGALHVVSVVGVEAKRRADQLRGAVAVSRLVEVAPLVARLAKLGLALRIEVRYGEPVVIGPAPAGAHARTTPMLSDAARGATLTVLSSSVLPSAGVLLAALALLLLSGVAAVLLWRRGRTPGGEPPLPDLVPEVHIDRRRRP